MAKVFPFTKLPAELRNKIYESLFKASTPILICRLRHACEPSTILRGRIEKLLEDGVLSAQFCLPPFGSETSVNGLLLNKTIKKEALPVLYGENTSMFRHRNDLHVFTAMIENNGRYLRHVMLDLKGSPWASPIAGLHPKACLRTMTFCIAPWVKVGYSAEYKDALWRSVRSYVQRIRGDAERRERFTAISVAHFESHKQEYVASTHGDDDSMMAGLEACLVEKGVLKGTLRTVLKLQ